MVLDLQEAPSALLKPVRHDVRRITDPDDLGDFAEVMTQTRQDAPANHIEHPAYALTNNPESLSIYVAYQGNVPVSAARISWHANSRFAGLWGGSTVKAYRQRGFYTALLAARLQEALRRNTCYLTIDASPMSRPILEKFGFQVLTYTYPCKRRKT
jgi:predicted GNAT family acetyltransferase